MIHAASKCINGTIALVPGETCPAQNKWPLDSAPDVETKSTWMGPEDPEDVLYFRTLGYLALSI